MQEIVLLHCLSGQQIGYRMRKEWLHPGILCITLKTCFAAHKPEFGTVDADYGRTCSKPHHTQVDPYSLAPPGHSLKKKILLNPEQKLNGVKISSTQPRIRNVHNKPNQQFHFETQTANLSRVHLSIGVLSTHLHFTASVARSIFCATLSLQRAARPGSFGSSQHALCSG